VKGKEPLNRTETKMELREVIREAMEKSHGLSQGERVIISCDYYDWENGWEVFSSMGTKERIHPDRANEKFYYGVNGWNIDNEENFQCPESLERFYPEEEAKRILQEMPQDMEDPVYDTDCDKWVERDEWIENAVDFYADIFYNENIDDISEKFNEEKKELDEEWREKIKEDMGKFKVIKNQEEYYNNFQLYMTEAGWQEWMREYTEAEDDELCSEKEIRQMEKIQKELWEDVHGDIDEYPLH